MKNMIKTALAVAGFTMLFSACTKDLDTVPLDKKEMNTENVYRNPANYKLILAKLYAGLATTGQQGPAGIPDISGIDEGFGQYIRMLFYLQELSTDEALITWNDATIKDFHYQTWGAQDGFIKAMYYRIFYQVDLCNEYLRQTTDDKLSERGITGSIVTDIHYYRAEARFLRALSYFHALDMFGSVPFVTEDDEVGAFLPEQISRAKLFDYIESELKAIENSLVEARQNEYGRADKAAAWALLAKLYLNAGIYKGENKYTECITYCNKVTDAGYSLVSNYGDMFLADNDLTSTSEVIFPVCYDGNFTKTYGGTDFIIFASVGGSMVPTASGINGGWAGLRTTSAFVALFPDTLDQRRMFYTNGQNLEIADVSVFTDGYAINKWKNLKSDGSQGSRQDFVDTDFPVLRLADVYLMYAEAVKRGGQGGDEATALGYLNALRERAYGDATHNISSYDLDYILDERGRELYWECSRRTDLIRYDKFTGGNYLWPWKGNVAEGQATESFYNLYPLPASDVNANPNLHQNTGY